MTIKPVAMTEEEIQIYRQEDNIAKLYERRQEEYQKLIDRLRDLPKPLSSGGNRPVELALDICEFLLREVQYQKLV